MKKLLGAILLLCLAIPVFSQVDTSTAEKKVRYQINNIRGKQIAKLPNYALSNSLKALADMAAMRIPIVTDNELRAGKADTASAVQVIRNGRVWTYRYVANSSASDDSAMVIRNGNRRYLLNTDVLTPTMFGAVGDSATNDTKAIQKCFDYVKANQTIDFQGLRYRFDSVTLIKPDVNLVGGGAQMMGILKIGNTTNRTYNMQISGFVFDFDGDPIKIQGVRKLSIHNNIFKKSNRSVYIVPGQTGTHVNGMIEVNKNVFNDVNYCFYADRIAGATWQVNSDCSFEGNTANNALITAVYANGIDGLKMTNNVIFTPSDEVRKVNKKHHLRIDGQSDWVIVLGNNFFESGEESIYLTQCKSLNVKGNNFAWSGQKGVYDVIVLRGTVTDYSVNISGNVFKSFSGNVITSVSTAYGVLDCTGNTINYTDILPGYFGSVDIATIDHYILNLGTNAVRYKESNAMDHTLLNLKHVKVGSLFSTNLTRNSASSVTTSLVRKITVVADTQTAVCSLRPGDTSIADNYSGELLIIAKNGLSSAANSAIYKIMISRFGATIEVVEIYRGGLVYGAIASHPSFTFALDTSGNLLATPIGLTAGTFYFTLKSEGDLALNDI